ncbi:MAG: hypothetical protein FWG75_02450 [Cystobacterineae bacterium]|nr:hypothetical protein [Cystobacterineae bacterium]
MLAFSAFPALMARIYPDFLATLSEFSALMARIYPANLVFCFPAAVTRLWESVFAVWCWIEEHLFCY